MRRWGKWLALLLLCAGCGAGSALPPGSEATSRHRGTTVAPQASFTVNLLPGWNGVGLQGEVESVSAPATAAGFVTWDGTAYQPGSLTPDQLNAGAGPRRGLWVFASASTSFSYATRDDVRFMNVGIHPGWNQLAIGSASPVAGSALSASGGSLTSLIFPQVYEIQPDRSYLAVDLQAGGSLQPGRAYWVFGVATGTLSWGSSAGMLSMAERAAVYHAVERQLSGVPEGASLQPVADLMARMPNLRRVRLSQDGLSVISSFTDGVPYTVLRNRDPGPPEPVAPQVERVAPKLFTGPKVLVMNGLGTLFTPFLDEVLRDIVNPSASGYTVSRRSPRTSTLRDPALFAGCAVVEINGHGGELEDRSTNNTIGPLSEYGLWTATLADNADSRDEADLRDLRMGVMTAPTNAGEDPETHLAVNANFVNTYWTFDGALVLIDTCCGDALYADGFKRTCFKRGARLYAGWSDNIGNQQNTTVTGCFLDRLLGANRFRSSVRMDPAYGVQTPPLRPFTWKPLFDDLSTRRLNVFSNPSGRQTVWSVYHSSNPGLAGGTDEPGGDEFGLAPSLEFMQTSEVDLPTKPGARLILNGSFGTYDAARCKVFLEQTELAVSPSEWTPSRITCSLPANGPFGGRVKVVVDGISSNAKPLTVWRGVLRVSEAITTNQPPITGQSNQTVDIDLHLRAMIHPHRRVPNGTPLVLGLAYGSIADSRFTAFTYSETETRATSGGPKTTRWGPNPAVALPLPATRDQRPRMPDLLFQLSVLNNTTEYPFSGQAVIPNAGIVTSSDTMETTIRDLRVGMSGSKLRLDPTNFALSVSIPSTPIQGNVVGTRTYVITGGNLTADPATTPRSTDAQ